MLGKGLAAYCPNEAKHQGPSTSKQAQETNRCVARKHEADLVVTEPLDAAKGGATPDGHSSGMNCGDIAALGGPLHKAFCPEAALVDLQCSRGHWSVMLVTFVMLERTSPW